MDARPQPDYRVGEPQDAAALADVTLAAFDTYREWTPDGWSPAGRAGERETELLAERLSLPNYWCLMAESGGEAAGYVMAHPAVTDGDDPQPIPGLAHIWLLFVTPTWWGTGVAKRLHDAALGEARRWECEAIRLWTPRRNARARAFYAREGWRETGAEQYSAQLDLELLECRRPVILDS
jgi:GNAT superfamily N-acetyltransferase